MAVRSSSRGLWLSISRSSVSAFVHHFPPSPWSSPFALGSTSEFRSCPTTLLARQNRPQPSGILRKPQAPTTMRIRSVWGDHYVMMVKRSIVVGGDDDADDNPTYS